MARYYTVYQSRTKALNAAARKANVEGVSQTMFTPAGAEPGWFIVGPTTDAPDLVTAGALPVLSVQAHGPSRVRVNLCGSCPDVGERCCACDRSES